MVNCRNGRNVPSDVETSDSCPSATTNPTPRYPAMTPRDRPGSRILFRMPDQSPQLDVPHSRRLSAQHLELPHPRRLIWTAAWNMAESVGLPFGAWIVVTDVAGRNPGLLAGLAVVWLLIAIRKVATGSVSALLMISAIVLTLQTAVVIFTGNAWMYLLQFPLANLAMCVLFARTAPTRKPLVAQLAAEVVALRQPETAHPGLHRFFQGATWFWAGLFLVLTLGMAVMMVTEPFKLFMLVSTAATIALMLVGAAVCVVWFLADGGADQHQGDRRGGRDQHEELERL